MSDATLQTEFEFTLPRGYVDDEGTVHKQGRMRLATAADEIQPLNDPRTQENGSYLTIILLSRVVEELGELSGDEVDAGVIESLFVADLEFLQGMYEQINDGSTDFPPAGAYTDAAGPGDQADSGDSSAATDGGDAADEDGGQGNA